MSTVASLPASEVSPSTAQRLALVVMGVSGTGKSTMATALASALTLPVFEGDELHAPQSVAKMKSGQALSDDDRWPWLERIGELLADASQTPAGLVVSCSALKRSYRNRLRQAAPQLRFVFLHGAPALIQARLQQRQGHYMPATLLASQLQTLEHPGADEPDVLHLDLGLAVNVLVDQVLTSLGKAAAGG
jgi:gluconokinase